MTRLLWEKVMHHRAGLGEATILVGILVGVGYFALVFDLTGNGDVGQHVEFLELVFLGLVAVGGLAIFGWRRIVEQEREIEGRLAAEERARYLAHHDHLTGLPNRRELQQALADAVAVPPGAERAHAVMLLDLNGFKKINDIFGHQRGDEVLSVVAQRLTAALTSTDLVARTGGDEFALVIREVGGADGAAGIATRIVAALDESITIGSDLHKVGTGVGIALIPRDGTDPGEVLRRADVALYKAKAAGRSSFAFYDDQMDKEARERDLIQRDLGAAIGGGSIVPHYQPIVDLKTGRTLSFEALARWTHPQLGEVPPDRFIPIAEDAGLIRALTESVLAQACQNARLWPEEIGLSFNFSPLLLKDRGFGPRLLEIVAESGLAPERLELEITENAIVRDLDAARDMLGTLREAGIRIALDDFGTGSTSLFHLRTFKFDVVKIDRSFIDLMVDESETAAVVKAIVGLAKGLGVDIVAEGIEQVAQSQALMADGCDTGQGFLFGRAMTGADTLAMFEVRQSKAS